MDQLPHSQTSGSLSDSAVGRSRVHSNRQRPGGQPHSASTGLYYRVRTQAIQVDNPNRPSGSALLSRSHSESARSLFTGPTPAESDWQSRYPASFKFKFASHVRKRPGPGSGETQWHGGLTTPCPMGTRVAPARRTPAKPPCCSSGSFGFAKLFDEPH